MADRSRFIVYGPEFREDRGGAIVLHKLCALLNEIGEDAYYWPIAGRSRRRKSLVARLKNEAKTWLWTAGRGIRPRMWSRSGNRRFWDVIDNPVARPEHLDGAIVVYPEVVDGNPLDAENVVRWFLNRPGFFTGRINYGEGELYFLFEPGFTHPDIEIDPDNFLTIWVRHPAYRQWNRGRRSGSCFMMRKEEEREISHDVSDSVRVDGMSHGQLARIFNTREIFYSYDETTMYSQYAALCGCTSVVIPLRFESREAWVSSHPIGKYGVAYGFDDLEHARDTRGELRRYLDRLEEESLESVRAFAERARAYFEAGRGASMGTAGS